MSEADCLRGVAGGSCPVVEILDVLARTEGPEAAIAALERLVLRSAETRRLAHDHAHAIGMSAYQGRETVGRVFVRCTPAFQSGCYHGVIQAYFRDLAGGTAGLPDAAGLEQLCREQRMDPMGRWLLFQCAHGVGHGFLALTGFHLSDALHGCDRLEDAWEREACYGGVFMENVVRATDPPRAGHAEHAPAAHSHSHEPAPEPVPAAFRPAEPAYPCSTLEDRYLAACWSLQTSAILLFNRYDVRATAATCAVLETSLRPVCFQSLGRDLSTLTDRQHSRAIRLCGEVPSAYESFCHVGYAKNLIDLTAQPADGIVYCLLLSAEGAKRACYNAIGEQISLLAPDADGREALCATVEDGFRETCRAGARLDAAGLHDALSP